MTESISVGVEGKLQKGTRKFLRMMNMIIILIMGMVSRVCTYFKLIKWYTLHVCSCMLIIPQSSSVFKTVLS